jgi:hypothetical protein
VPLTPDRIPGWRLSRMAATPIGGFQWQKSMDWTF